MTVVLRSRKREKGQAITEMTVGLLGLSFVMIGVLIFALLGWQNIRCTMEARRDADAYSVKGYSNGNAENLQDWKWDNDLFLYGNGNKVVNSPIDTGTSMLDELSDKDKTYDLRKDADKFKNSGNPFVNLTESNLFSDASELTLGYVAKEDVLQQNHFMMGPNESGWNSNVVSLFLQGQKDFTLTGRIWMPVNNMRLTNE